MKKNLISISINLYVNICLSLEKNYAKDHKIIQAYIYTKIT